MKKVNFFVLVLLLLISFKFSSLSVEAATPAIELEVIPNALQLAPGEDTEILIIARNSSEGSLQSLQLSWLVSAGVAVDTDAPDVEALGPASSHTWKIHITRTLGGLETGSVYFQLDYVWKANDETRPVPGSVVGVLKIQERQFKSVEQVANVKVETALESLQEYQPGSVFLVLNNVSSFPVRVVDITEQSPQFVDVGILDADKNVQLEAGETHVFPITVKTENAVRSGNHMLLFEIDLEWKEAGQTREGTLVTTHTLNVGTLGVESAILALVGAPAFVLLPGFLMLITFIALWTRCVPKKKLELEVKSPEFGLLAITLSFVAYLLYLGITKRNYLVGYGLLDVFLIWFGSTGLAILTWLVVVGIRKLVIKRKTLTKDDEPIIMLRKLARNGVEFPLKQVDVQVGQGRSWRCFVLLDDRERKEIWVALPIRLTWGATAEWQTRKELVEQLREKNPNRLADLLKQAMKKRVVKKIDWRQYGKIKGPTSVEADRVQVCRDLSPRYFFEEE